MIDLWRDNSTKEVNPEAVHTFLLRCREEGKMEIDAYRELMEALEIDVKEFESKNREKQKQIAKMIYDLFCDNMESLRTFLLDDPYASKLRSSDLALATKLRSEIKKSRLYFGKNIVDELLALTIDLGCNKNTILRRPEYKESVFAGMDSWNTEEKATKFCTIVIPALYEKLEDILSEYMEFA